MLMTSCQEWKKVGVMGGGRFAWTDLSMGMEMDFGRQGWQGVVSHKQAP